MILGEFLRFQSTRPRGTRPSCQLTSSASASFNPRVREGRDFDNAVARRSVPVSIHASARDATHPQVAAAAFCLFQSTRPRGTRRKYGLASVGSQKFQSTRPRGTRRRESQTLCNLLRFNPRVREGRDVSAGKTAAEARFQSTRPRGTRRNECRIYTANLLFQSTRPRGTRPYPQRTGSLRSVSIHASARDATRVKTITNSCNGCFNPRVREGRDFKTRRPSGRLLRFQSTRPRGTRQFITDVPDLKIQFQSTRPRGTRRKIIHTKVLQFSVSIHASARDATTIYNQNTRVLTVSIHASARDATYL